ncbi:NUDIX hydrolase [Acinetobacter pollinis]|jgi:8-oxo-dGTP diphosphatase|uniref:NUDIX hydrolase n=1 Tax=Acinetobacter pollinis TaxID=2605270 RepID=UPI0018A29A91|nr:NUDIX domain-containing protein [Acinetobacter pollinis]MBF7691514.1 NUDIX domain-containing protein [Acinetobacter pollinis]MBF7693767.1 NUDIX domain-containing protein [Acinetobacter pollinis]MBF7699009.1 NUDIX domain-containing protein [Acinetobacter pollinis]MBF7701340.1 NUDIX domain-containing protein [Acinetobacter pollinis]
MDQSNNLITVAAAIILNEKGELLLVRKRGTLFYMQVGGKLENGEAPNQALIREIKEEIGLEATIIKSYGEFYTQAANEKGFDLKAYLYHVKIDGQPKLCSEIEEIIWINPSATQYINIAPLTLDIVFPLVRRELS